MTASQQKSAAKARNGEIPKRFAHLMDSLQMENNTIVVFPGTPSASLTTAMPSTELLDQNTNEEPIKIDMLKNKVIYYSKLD